MIFIRFFIFIKEPYLNVKEELLTNKKGHSYKEMPKCKLLIKFVFSYK